MSDLPDFVLKGKKPEWFWRLVRRFKKLLFNKGTIEIIDQGISFDYGAEEPFYIKYKIDTENKYWININD